MTAMGLDVGSLLDHLDDIASQRPVAARVVATANDANAGAADLAAVLGGDPTMAAKVMKMANSAFFGLSGKVTSLQLAVAVVGFTTVRSVATVELSGVEASQSLPDGFWDISVHLAAAASTLGPAFQRPAADAMCLGLLAQIGAALLHETDPVGYAEVLATTDLGEQRFEAEESRYGIGSPQLTAAALEHWDFPAAMVQELRAMPSGPEAALLRTAYELSARLLCPGHEPISLGRLSLHRITEDQAPTRLAIISGNVATLRSALGL